MKVTSLGGKGGGGIKCNRMMKQLKKFGMLTAIANVIRLPFKKMTNFSQVA